MWLISITHSSSFYKPRNHNEEQGENESISFYHSGLDGFLQARAFQSKILELFLSLGHQADFVPLEKFPGASAPQSRTNVGCSV